MGEREGLLHDLDPEAEHWFLRLNARLLGSEQVKLEKLVAAVQADAFRKAEAQAIWRSTPEIMRVLDSLDEYTSTLSQAYAHAHEPMPNDLREVIKLTSSLSLRVRSQFRCAETSE